MKLFVAGLAALLLCLGAVSFASPVRADHEQAEADAAAAPAPNGDAVTPATEGEAATATEPAAPAEPAEPEAKPEKTKKDKPKCIPSGSRLNRC